MGLLGMDADGVPVPVAETNLPSRLRVRGQHRAARIVSVIPALAWALAASSTRHPTAVISLESMRSPGGDIVQVFPGLGGPGIA